MVGPWGGVHAKGCTNRVLGVGVVESLLVEDCGREISFTFDDMMRYHGAHSPAGVAMAFKVMQRAFAALSPDGPTPRREVTVRTAFRGPGARDGFEAVTRGVTDGRYTVDRSWSLSAIRPQRCCCVTVSSPGSSSIWPAPIVAPPSRKTGLTN